MFRNSKKLNEKLSIMLAKNPSGVILIAILLLNIVIIAASALIISALAPANIHDQGFWASVYYTISMILDAGAISNVVADVGQASVTLIIACLITVVLGSITFTGAVIGYVTNYISEFISTSDAGERKLRASNHTVILNWNSRASEIVNDLIYSKRPEVVVILVNDGREAIERELQERFANTLDSERRILRTHIEKSEMGFFKAWRYYVKHTLRNRVTVIVREGDTFSTQKLNDISIQQARTIIILGKDIQNSVCKFETMERLERNDKGNTNTIKTLIQVAELASSDDSAEDQKIVVETDDEWTLHLVKQIMAHKEQHGGDTIVPLMVNRVLGQILSQFSIMPELNIVYRDLFSNKGASFFSEPADGKMLEERYIGNYLYKNTTAIPLTCMTEKGVSTMYYLADDEDDVHNEIPPYQVPRSDICVNRKYRMERHYIIVLGHNSKTSSIMQGFQDFSGEWDYTDPDVEDPNILKILVIDDKKHLEKMGNYEAYPQVVGTIAADVYDKQTICDAIREFVMDHQEDTSILILSDDSVTNEEMDANALTYLIYVQEIKSALMKANPGFRSERVDVVVEILNPKNYDIVHSYNIDNIVISNRYLSKMITQIGEKDNLYAFYNDILTYDDPDSQSDSKELYIKPVGTFLTQVPDKCTAAELIRNVYNTSPKGNRSIVLGVVHPDGEMQIFSGNQNEIILNLRAEDKLIIFSSH